jgi:hypothetical protein
MPFIEIVRMVYGRSDRRSRRVAARKACLALVVLAAVWATAAATPLLFGASWAQVTRAWPAYMSLSTRVVIGISLSLAGVLVVVRLWVVTSAHRRTRAVLRSRDFTENVVRHGHGNGVRHSVLHPHESVSIDGGRAALAERSE